MDPQATWRLLLDAWVNSDWAMVHESAESLLDWIDKNGFPPETNSGRHMGNLWNRTVTECVCRFAVELASRVHDDANGIPSGVSFTLQCRTCSDTGPASFALAIEQGWTRIVFAPAGAAGNFLGDCPKHSHEPD